MDWRKHIVSDKGVLLGKPVIKGTRIYVELILELMADGWTEQQILESYPTINQLQLRALIQITFTFLPLFVSYEHCKLMNTQPPQSTKIPLPDL